MNNENEKTELTEEDKNSIIASLQTMNEFAIFFQYDVLNSRNEELLQKILKDTGGGELDKLQIAINNIADAIGEGYLKKR